MFLKKKDGFSYGPNVLIAPLDWGLGHATRCIPLIYSLLNNGATVFIAASGATRVILEKEFPLAVFLPLPGYNIQYSRTGRGLPFKLLLQLPRIFASVYREQRWLKKTINNAAFDLVISDNRPGLYTKKIPAVYITHQLAIKTGSRYTERWVQKIHYYFINKYKYCWVPDNAGSNSLAGSLSHPLVLPQTPVVYTGILSRFKKTLTAQKYTLLVLLSGPEPQRSIFEDLLLSELKQYDGKVLFIRGLPGTNTMPEPAPAHVTIHNHMDAAALNNALLQSEMIICRSGYTSVMDLCVLQKKAILVATPGQTEQEYLAAYLHGKKIFYAAAQDGFNLQEALAKAAAFPFAIPQFTGNENIYDEVIAGVLQSLKRDQ